MTRLAKILIAEDDHTIAHVVERVLEDTQLYRVAWVTDGDAVLEAVAEDMPDLVLLDLMMPKRNGFEVCRALREDPRSQDLPICIMTALTDERAHQTARDAGADDILMKPFRANALRSLVRTHLSSMSEVALEPATLHPSPPDAPSWSQLVGSFRQLTRSLATLELENAALVANVNELKLLVQQAERRLADTLTAQESPEELDIRVVFREWGSRYFGESTALEQDDALVDRSTAFLSEVDAATLETFLESLYFDITAGPGPGPAVELKCERNGQTLALRCKVVSPKASVPNGLSGFSIELSKLLGISVSLNDAPDGQPEYFVYLPASQSLAPSKLERPVDEAILEEAWSGLLVSVNVVLCTDKGDIRGSLRALGPRGAVLGQTSDPTDQLGAFEGEVLELRFPEFGDCKAGAFLYRRNGEWALLWRNVSKESMRILSDIRRSAPGGGLLTTDR